MSCFAMTSGRLIDINNFNANDIDIEDIAHHLSKIQRFNGATPSNVSYTVGEHSINLANYFLAKFHPFCRDHLAAVALIHDASEAYMGDLISPVKEVLPDYILKENAIQLLIKTKYLPSNVNSTIKNIDVKKEDKRILIDEVETLMPDKLDLYKKESGLEKLGCHIMYNNHPSTIKVVFLNLCKQLGIR